MKHGIFIPVQLFGLDGFPSLFQKTNGWVLELLGGQALWGISLEEDHWWRL
jgi:hypothetical protein